MTETERNLLYGVVSLILPENIGISQFERDMIHERTMEGLNAARKRGRLGGRPKIPTDDVEAALKMYDSKSFTLAEIEMRTGVKRPTLYLY